MLCYSIGTDKNFSIHWTNILLNRGRIVQVEGANQPKGEQVRGRTSQRENKPGEKPVKGRKSQEEKNRGESARGRNGKRAKKP